MINLMACSLLQLLEYMHVPMREAYWIWCQACSQGLQAMHLQHLMHEAV